MTDSISCIVIQSDHLPRKIPALGQIVRVVDRSGLFVVLSADREDRKALLMEKGGRHQLFEVPFASLRTLNSDLSRTIRTFLDSVGNATTEETTHEPQP